MSPELEVKGHVLRLFVSTVEELVGADIRDAMIQQSPEAVQQALRYSHIVPGGWYPIAWYRDLHAALAMLVPSDRQLPQRIGRRATQIDLAGLNGWLLKLLAPKTIASITTRCFGTYFRGGLATSEPMPGGICCQLTRCHGMDIRILNEWAAGGQYALEVGGVRNVRFACTQPDPELCVIRYYWD